MSRERLTLEDYQKAATPGLLKAKLCHPGVIEHRQRYHFAAEVIASSAITSPTIIDAASGCGWGSVFIADSVADSTIVGIDRDKETIAEAMAYKNGRPRVSFWKADLLNADGLNVTPADWVVSFETLEHFNKDQVAILLANFHRLHNSRGNLLISTPNGPIFSPYTSEEGHPWTKFHCREYSSEELVDTLWQQDWETITLYGQRFINPDFYLLLAKKLYILRQLISKLNLPENHRLNFLPYSILWRFAASKSSGTVSRFVGNKEQPLFLIAECQSRI
jgi:2-polyprenyl-3-methyl-5-hydroxy-6-metoxy-1,4-benzoquinol methylase